jgi:hypothetical protein
MAGDKTSKPNPLMSLMTSGSAAETVSLDTVAATTKLTPFQFIDTINNTKNDLTADDPDAINQYVPFIVNRGLGYFADTVLYANELNLYPTIPPAAQYQYLLTAVRRRKRFSKWHKTNADQDLVTIQQAYGVRPEVARQYQSILTAEQVGLLRDLIQAK